jgi:two-component system nitrogen regulation response regulator GlnG
MSVDSPAPFSEQEHYPSFKEVEEALNKGDSNLYLNTVNATERSVIRQVLKHTQGNQFKAASILGISRVTLRSKLKSLGIDLEDFRSP